MGDIYDLFDEDNFAVAVGVTAKFDTKVARVTVAVQPLPTASKQQVQIKLEL